jgi:amino acid adenylation domain-containing protein
LFLDKSTAAVVAMHGVLKADGVYVPVDMSSPAPRLRRIVESCRPKAILCESSSFSLMEAVLADLDFQPIIGTLEDAPGESGRFDLAFDATDLENAESKAPISRNVSSDPAHILFTSGSTGAPKGVVLSHGNVRHFVDWGKETFRIKSTDRNSGHPPLHFDLSTFDIFGTLAAGARLHLVPAMANLLPTSLAKFIRDMELTQWFSVPSVLTMMARSGVIEEGDFPSLKRLIWCGEVLPTSTLIHLMERLPHVEFTNLYGPTETTIASSFHTVKECPGDPLERIPIGTPCEGEDFLVLDSELQPVAEGVKGELYIGGAGLSQGYWRDPDKTDESFLTLPDSISGSRQIYRTGDIAYRGEDGFFYFVGRNDSQIKSRGYRIEIGEIEVALNSLNMLRECAVVGVPSTGFEGTAICCAFVPQKGAKVTPETLRANASKLLPGYMLPHRWKLFESLPRTGNGKSDRRRIEEAFKAVPSN